MQGIELRLRDLDGRANHCLRMIQGVACTTHAGRGPYAAGFMQEFRTIYQPYLWFLNLGLSMTMTKRTQCDGSTSAPGRPPTLVY